MKSIKTKISILLFDLAFVLLPLLARAQLKPPNPKDTKLPDISGGEGVAGIVYEATQYLLGLASVIAVLFIIIGGFQYIFSGANEALAKKGKQTLTNAVIGLIIIILSFTIVTIIFNELISNKIRV